MGVIIIIDYSVIVNDISAGAITNCYKWLLNNCYWTIIIKYVSGIGVCNDDDD